MPISISGNGPSLTVGGRTFTDLTNLKVFYVVIGISNQYDTFIDASDITNTKYVVPGGKTLKIHAMKFFGSNNATEYVNMGYGDTSVSNSVSAPTNLVAQNGFMLNITGAATGSDSTTNTTSHVFAWGQPLSIPTGKYPCLQDNTSASCVAYIYGYEV